MSFAFDICLLRPDLRWAKNRELWNQFCTLTREGNHWVEWWYVICPLGSQKKMRFYSICSVWPDHFEPIGCFSIYVQKEVPRLNLVHAGTKHSNHMWHLLIWVGCFSDFLWIYLPNLRLLPKMRQESEDPVTHLNWVVSMCHWSNLANP